MKQIISHILGEISFIVFTVLIIAFTFETIKALPTLILTILVMGLFALVAIVIDRLFKR